MSRDRSVASPLKIPLSKKRRGRSVASPLDLSFKLLLARQSVNEYRYWILKSYTLFDGAVHWDDRSLNNVWVSNSGLILRNICPYITVGLQKVPPPFAPLHTLNQSVANHGYTYSLSLPLMALYKCDHGSYWVSSTSAIRYFSDLNLWVKIKVN